MIKKCNGCSFIASSQSSSQKQGGNPSGLHRSVEDMGAPAKPVQKKFEALLSRKANYAGRIYVEGFAVQIVAFLCAVRHSMLVAFLPIFRP
jgi:hypothetical protein